MRLSLLAAEMLMRGHQLIRKLPYAALCAAVAVAAWQGWAGTHQEPAALQQSGPSAHGWGRRWWRRGTGSAAASCQWHLLTLAMAMVVLLQGQ
jgi:hypothetical protein